MGDFLHPPSEAERRARYRVELLGSVHPCSQGLARRDGPRGSGELLVAWSRIESAVAAEVGEPEGVRIIVFDLLVGRQGDRLEICRLDAEPGDEALALAPAIESGMGPERQSASVKSLATDGTPSRWYPDLRSFEEAALELLEA
jgi:hypothetical protein